MTKIVGFIALSAAFLLLAGTALERYTHSHAKDEMLRRDNSKKNLEALEKADESGESNNLLLEGDNQYGRSLKEFEEREKSQETSVLLGTAFLITGLVLVSRKFNYGLRHPENGLHSARYRHPNIH
jgi:hypothetical protein